MITDSIGNYLTSIRNAILAEHKTVSVPSSNLKKEITKVLMDQGYILNYKFDKNGAKELIKIALKYNSITKIPAIRGLDRVSKPGLRKYSSADRLPRVLNGLGVAIVSTSKGIMTDKKARNMNIGGEVICHVY
jgi:small subunit ribosomal protein S8